MAFVPMAFCTPCGVGMVVQRNDHVLQVEGAHGPYYKIHTDLLRCDSCGHQVAIPARAPAIERGPSPEAFDAYPHEGEATL